MLRPAALLAVTVLSSLLGCAPAPGADDAAVSSGAIVSGTEAGEAKLDAVVAIAYEDEKGRQIIGTGTLVAPRLVLTARHVVKDLDPLLRSNFRVLVGPNAAKPRAVRKVVDVEQTEPAPKNGNAGFGADEAFLALDRAITDVTPLPMLGRSLAAEDVGAELLTVGFGVTDATGDVRTTGMRNEAREKLVAASGPPVFSPTRRTDLNRWLADNGYPSVDELEKEQKDAAEAIAKANEENAKAGMSAAPDPGLELDEVATPSSDPTLFEGYEVEVSNTGSGFTCLGDSGGPHLLSTAAGYVVAGVTSSGFAIGKIHCLPGATIVGTFGPLTRGARARLEARLK